MRIAAAEAKGRDALAEARADADRRIEEDCDKAMRKQEYAKAKRREHMAQEEQVRQAKAEKQAAKQAEAAAKKQKKIDEKKEEARHKAEKKAEKALKQARRKYLGGTAWGYDPNAGVSKLPDCPPADIKTSNYGSSGRDGDRKGSSRTSESRASTPQVYDRVTGKYYPKNEFDSVWGIEIGGPTYASNPGPHPNRFANAMAEVDKTFRVDRSGLSRGPEPGSPDFKGKGKGRGKDGVGQSKV